MFKILIVDDEKIQLKSMTMGLAILGKELQIHKAENGKQAITVLNTIKIDIVITDIMMPEMDGIALLTYINNNYPRVAVIAMSASSKPEYKVKTKQLGANMFLQKPVKIPFLYNRICEILGSTTGQIRGISLPSFLQLLEMERKSCVLQIASNSQIGELVFHHGKLVYASTEKLRAENAAHEIIGWEQVKIRIKNISKSEKVNITHGLTNIIMDALKLKDENSRDKAKVSPDKTKVKSDKAKVKSEVLKSRKTKAISKNSKTKLNSVKEKIMALESYLATLKGINGYKASAIMNYKGEVLASDTLDTTVDLNLIGPTFNDIFRAAHEASKLIELDACNETVITTPKGIIVMACSGEEATSHFHVIGVLGAEGNQALMKVHFNKIIPGIAKELG